MYIFLLKKVLLVKKMIKSMFLFVARYFHLFVVDMCTLDVADLNPLHSERELMDL